MREATPQLGVCLLTGGAGFLAGRIARRLVDSGHTVRSIDLREPDWSHPRFEHRGGDLRDLASIQDAFEGVGTVFHTAAIVDLVGLARPWRRRRSFELNVDGTRNVVVACQRHRVRRLIYTSSNNVLLGPPIENATSESPYPDHHVDLYSETKRIAEEWVLKANGRSGLSTTALRPGGIYGVGDTVYLPQLIDKLYRGLLIADVGDGRSMADNTYVENLAIAQLQAARALTPESRLAGRAYYITDGEPTPPMEFFRPIIEGLGYGFPKRRVPYRLVYAFGWLWELLHRLYLAPNPAVTRVHAMKAAVSHSGSIEEAKRDFGYEPLADWRQQLEDCLPYCEEVLDRMRKGDWPNGR